MKPIKLSEDFQKQVQADFATYLLNSKFNSNRVTYSFDLKAALNIKEKAKVWFTFEAWTKMRALVNTTDTEIAWHGYVEKLQTPNEYLITDVFMYPQYVAGSTVQTEDESYIPWLNTIPDDKISQLRFQGHSHVNMGTTPSGVDSNFYESLLCNLKQDDYYIFAIMNKRNELNVWVYDYAQNVIFEKEDITWEVTIGNTKSLGTG
jgi:hypothetical protein